MTDDWRTRLDALPTASITLVGSWDTPSEFEVPQDVPVSYMLPHRRRLRWEIVEYLRMDGRVTKEVHLRRFWLYRSARRYMDSFRDHRDGQLIWRWSDPWKWPCRIGLHFLRYDLAVDGYACACRRIHLWAEEIVP